MNHIALDLKDAFRALWRDLGYTATAVVTLALTIGATTATFSIVNGVLLKPLAYRESQQLVAIRDVAVELMNRFPVLPVNGRHFEEWRSQAQAFEALAEFVPLSANLTGAGDPVQIDLVRTSGGLFDVLQVPPALGRPLRADDERRDAEDVAVIVPLRLPEDLGWVGDFNYVALGRLKRGVSAEQARADLDVVQTSVSRR